MFVRPPEKVIIGDDPAHEEGEEGHEEELGDKTNQGSDWLFEHLDNDLHNNTNYSKNIITRACCRKVKIPNQYGGVIL